MSVTRALFAVALLTAPAPTLAAALPAHQSAVVTAADLDLATEEGQRILALRIHRAARTLCKAAAVDRLPQTIRAERECLRQARTSDAVAVKGLAEEGTPEPDRGG